MASKRPMPLRWWAIACYVAGGFIMYQAYVGGRAEEAPPYSIYRDSADPYWRVIATGRSGDWFDLKNSQRVSEGTTAIRAR